MLDITTSNTEKVIDFLQLHYKPNENMYSYIIFGCKNTYCDIQDAGIRNFQFIKTTEVKMENESILNIVDSLDRKVDYYLTQNGFSTPMKRDLGHIFTLHNIVIDIDCHTNRMTKQERDYTIDACSYFLYHDLFTEVDFPMPNTIVNTGRGLQLWWAINPISYKVKHPYYEVRKYLIYRIESIIKSVETLRDIKVDKLASQNYVGYFRVPGSYNSKTDEHSTFQILHDDKLDVFDMYYVDMLNAKKLEKKLYKKCNSNNENIKSNNGSKKKKVSKKQIKSKNNLVAQREKMLYELLEIRRGEEEGIRDLMLLILYNAYLSAGKTQEEGREAIDDLNERFSHPLTDKEINSYMSTSTRKKYKFSNKKIIELLAMSKSEQEMLDFYDGDSSNKIDGKNECKKNEKEERNNRILDLNCKGYSQQDIAKEVGCSQSTVSRIIGKNHKDNQKVA